MDAKELRRIEKHLSGKLTIEEKEVFEKDLRRSKELAKIRKWQHTLFMPSTWWD